MRRRKRCLNESTRPKRNWKASSMRKGSRKSSSGKSWQTWSKRSCEMPKREQRSKESIRRSWSSRARWVQPGLLKSDETETTSERDRNTHSRPEKPRSKHKKRHDLTERSERGREFWKRTGSAGRRKRDSGERIKRRRGSRKPRS